MSDSVQPHRRQPTRLPHPWDSPGKNTGVGCHFLLQCMKVKRESEVAQLCPTLHDPMDCSPPGSSIHGIFHSEVPLASPNICIYTHIYFRFIYLITSYKLLSTVPCAIQEVLVGHLVYNSTVCILGRRQWHPTPILLPGESHGWRSLVGCRPWGH